MFYLVNFEMFAFGVNCNQECSAENKSGKAPEI